MGIKNLDENTLSKLSECKTKEEAKEVAGKLGIELSDDDLDEVNGGGLSQLTNPMTQTKVHGALGSIKPMQNYKINPTNLDM